MSDNRQSGSKISSSVGNPVHKQIMALFDAALANHRAKNQNVGIDHMLLTGHAGQQRGVSLFQGKIDSVEIADEIKLGVWLCTQGRWGCATLESVDAEALERAIEQAKLAAQFSDADADYELAQPQQAAASFEPYMTIAAYTMTDFEAIAREMEAQALAFSPLIKNIPRIGSGASLAAHITANSAGVRIVERHHFLKAGLSVMAAGEDGRMVNCYEMQYATDREAFQPDAVVTEVAQEVVARVSPRSVKSGRWQVLFDARSAAQLLETFASVFSGDFLYRKLTRLDGKLGKGIASESVSIRDVSDEGLVCHAYDAEGTPCQDKYLIRGGVFESFMHNLYTARKTGMATTGNAVGGLGEAPAVAPTNLMWEGAGQSLDALCRQMQTGIIVKELHGASASPISGDFSYGVLGYWVEAGTIQYPVADFTIAGNFFDLLGAIEALGDELRWKFPHASGSYGGRALLVGELAVSGS